MVPEYRASTGPFGPSPCSSAQRGLPVVVERVPAHVGHQGPERQQAEAVDGVGVAGSIFADPELGVALAERRVEGEEDHLEAGLLRQVLWNAGGGARRRAGCRPAGRSRPRRGTRCPVSPEHLAGTSPGISAAPRWSSYP